MTTKKINNNTDFDNDFAKCGYIDVLMTLELRKLLTALDDRGELYEKPYIDLNRGELTYDEFESIKDICKQKTGDNNE